MINQTELIRPRSSPRFTNAFAQDNEHTCYAAVLIGFLSVVGMVIAVSSNEYNENDEKELNFSEYVEERWGAQRPGFDSVVAP